MITQREIAGRIHEFQSLTWRGGQVLLLPADFVIQWRGEEGAGVALLTDFVCDNLWDAKGLLALTPGELFVGGGGAAPFYHARCVRASGRFTAHHPLTGDVIGTAKTEAAARALIGRIAPDEVFVVLDKGGVVAACDPQANTPPTPEAFVEMRARWDAAVAALPRMPAPSAELPAADVQG